MTNLSRQIRTIVLRVMIVTATVSLFSIDFVWSACSAPVANIGALDFQSSVFKYCDGTNWLSLSTPSFPLQGPNGSVAAPTYSFSAGTNTGIYSTGAGTIAFATAGTQRLVIDSSGNIGIGTTTPWSKLHLKETTAGTSSQTASYFEQILQPTADLTGTGGSGALYAETTIPAGTRKFRSVFGSFSDMKNLGSGSITDMNGAGGYVENTGTTKISNMSGIHGGAYQNIAAATISNLNGGYFYSESDLGTIGNLNGLSVNTWGGGGVTTNMTGLLVSTLKWSGTVTNRYGVYIDSPGAGDAGVTNEYGVYQEFATAKNHFAGQIRAGTGSVGAPGYSFIGDTDSGLYQLGQGTLALASNGAQFMLYRPNTSEVDVGAYMTNFNYPWGATVVSINSTAASGPTGVFQVQSGTGATLRRASLFASTLTAYTGTESDNGSIPFQIRTNSQPAIHVDTSQNVGIGTLIPGYKLHVVGTAGLSTGTAWTNASDARLKDIHGIYEVGLDEILKLRTVRYNYKKGNALGLPSDHAMIGFIAQEVRTAIPDAVKERADGYLELNVDPIHWASVNAIQELHGMCHDNGRGIASVSDRTSKLEAENSRLRDENAQIKAYLCAKDPAAPFCSGR